MDIVDDARSRRDAFYGMGFSEGNSGDHWDYNVAINDLLSQSLENVEGLMGEIAVEPLYALVRAADGDHSEAGSWREAIKTSTVGMNLPISNRIDEAFLYGYSGVTQEKVPFDGRADYIADLVAEVSAFAARSDVQVLNGGDNAIVRIANLATSRHALDTGRGEVDVPSLAILGKVSEGRIRNLLSEADGPFERGPGGGIGALGALSWLQKRKGFMDSIWAQDDPRATEPSVEEDTSPVDPDHAMFVPVARDGSLFNPDLVRDGRYQIGAKGEEQHFTDFTDALAALNAMPTPRWRRPNAQGNWGIVSGVAWQRVARPETVS